MLINNLSMRVSRNRDAIDAAVKRVLDRSWLVLGPEVAAFEADFADYLSVGHCVTCANGTDALELSLRALGVGPESLVATVANAGGYTTTALLAIGATPYYMDVDITSRNATLVEVQKALTLGVNAVVVTHLFGLAVPEIIEIASLCRSKNVPLIEDCAQAHGAKLGNQRVGTFGDAATFSFYPTKNLGALGDGGAVVTNHAEVAEVVSRLRQYGWTSKYRVEVSKSRNSRLDELQAAILSVFLPGLDSANARRRKIATEYSQSIRNPKVKTPQVYGEEFVAHLYVVEVQDRDNLQKHLKSFDIATDIHYPIPDYRQPVFGSRFATLKFSNTEMLSNEVLTLPCYPEMSDSDVDLVVDAVNSWV